MKKFEIAFALSSLALAGCHFSESRFYIVNETSDLVRDVTVSDGTRIWKLGDISPGASVEFKGRLAGEGGADIVWLAGNKRFSDKGCYHSSGVPAHGTVLIAGKRLKFGCG